MSYMKKICVFTNTLISGGTEKQAVLLSKVLNTKYNIWLVVYYGELVEEKFVNIISEEKIKLLCLKGSHLFKIIKLYKFIRKESIDIIFSYLLTTNFIGGIIGKFAGVCYTIGGIRSSFIPKNKRFIQKFLQNYVNDYTIYNNFSGIINLKAIGINGKKAVFIPNCIELRSSITIRKEKDFVNIISVGRFDAAKDYFTALRAIKILSEQNDIMFTYQIVGYGVLEEEIRKWIEKLKLQGIVKINVNSSNIEPYYLESDIYLSTSIFEGLSNTILEAMNYSLPIVATNVGDNDRLIINGQNGFLCSLKDSKAIAERLMILSRSQEMRNKFGERSYKILKENYSLDIFKKKYINFIESLE